MDNPEMTSPITKGHVLRSATFAKKRRLNHQPKRLQIVDLIDALSYTFASIIDQNVIKSTIYNYK